MKNAGSKYGKAFYRQIAYQNSSPTEWIEAFYNISYSQNEIKKVHIDQARFARKKYDTSWVFISHINFSILSVGTQLFTPKDPAGEIRAGKPFSEDFTPKYDFLISKSYKKGEDVLYEITFKPGGEMEGSLKFSVSSHTIYLVNTCFDLF